MPRSAIHTRPTTPWRASIVLTMVCTVRGVVGVAGEHLVAQREAVEGHHQGDADLLAVGPMIAAVAALRQRVGLRLALEVGAGHVVQQHLVVDRKQLAAALATDAPPARPCARSNRSSARYSRSLLTRSPSSCSRSRSAVRRYQSSAMCSSLDGSHSRAATSTAAIFAHGTASLPDGRSCSHRSPGPCRATAPAPDRHRRTAASVPHARPSAAPAPSIARWPSSNRPACSGSPIRCARQRPRLQPASLVELAKLRHRLLDHTTADPHAAHQTPVAMNLAVLLPRRVAQVHALITTQLRLKRKWGWSALHAVSRFTHHATP